MGITNKFLNISLKKFEFSRIVLILAVFIFGLYFYVRSHIFVENMENQEKKYDNKCGNMLIEMDGKILLYNSNKKPEEGKNPIEFKSLEEYKDHLKWQQSKGLKCPILFLQHTKDTQNNDVLQIKPSIFESDGGLQPNSFIERNKMLDATLDSTPGNVKFNTGMYAGFDQYNQNIGLDTVLDNKFRETNDDGKSRNPYDKNWGGKGYTENAIDRGDYANREVYKYKNSYLNSYLINE